MEDTSTARFVLMPPRPGVCQVCAVKHDPEQPHNRDSLYYQYRFYAEHKRWPTWADAMSHMPAGSIWEVYIPQELAYGEREQGMIKPFSVLKFKIELLEVNPKK